MHSELLLEYFIFYVFYVFHERLLRVQLVWTVLNGASYGKPPNNDSAH